MRGMTHIAAGVAAFLAAAVPLCPQESGTATRQSRLFELRTYTAQPGKLSDLHKLFRPAFRCFLPIPVEIPRGFRNVPTSDHGHV